MAQTAETTAFQGPPLESEPGIGALTIGGFFEETTARHAGKEALVFHDGPATLRLTYSEMREQVRQLAKALMGGGLVRGSRVALLMGNRPEWVISAFAVSLAGGVLVPVTTFAEPPELEYILRHSGASILLTQRQLAGHAYLDQLQQLAPELARCTAGHIRSATFPDLRRIVSVGIDAPDGPIEPWAALASADVDLDDDQLDRCAAGVSPADDALVVYTSGSTAFPKAVLHAQRAPALQSWRFARLLCLEGDVRAWTAMPFFWTAGFAMAMGSTFAAGGCMVLQEVFEPGETLRLLEEERVTTPHMWAHHMAMLEDHPDWAARDLSSLRHVESFASFGRHKTLSIDDVWSNGCAYGTSETFTILSSTQADVPAAEREGHHGPILPGNTVHILDPFTHEPLPAGMDGEIAVKGPTLMKGYLGKVPEDCFDRDGFFRTGDSGFVDEQGRLHWTGRTSGLIKTGGANVSPVEIEEILLRHPGLLVARAVGVPDERLGEIVVLCAVAHQGSTVDEEDVRQFLRGKLASYKIPRRVLFFEESELSMTGTAKVRGEPLRALAVERLSRQ